MIKALFGFVSEATAYLVDDYPYGFRLRCKIRYWMESHPKRGYRLVSQTSNPKRGDAWNKPKASTYSDLAVMYIDDAGHVQQAALHASSGPERFAEFKALFPDLPDEAEAKRLRVMEIVSRKYNPNSWAAWDAKQAAPVAAPEGAKAVM